MGKRSDLAKRGTAWSLLITEIDHSTIIRWVEDGATKLDDNLSEIDQIPEITEIDELQTFVGNKKNKIWIWTVVNHWKPGILLWTIGEVATLVPQAGRSSQTFEILWQLIKFWQSFWYVSDAWKVYQKYIKPEGLARRGTAWAFGQQNLYD